ncbi:YkgJ family cysteine cluster protein [uncultured Methanoregula sp.]|uniref:YkgJ family cysteine cluster protein n=1 Tax=uncultured Methanoregula sp. TaxID=1005933 RepID=UPI002AABD3F4|nr:YkgJ family cysteine cluster protein [uncultured Methanoregula sp.]
MTDDWLLKAEDICHTCGGHCCDNAHPPLSSERIAIILKKGDFLHCIEKDGYHFIRSKANGECCLQRNGKCQIHDFKPETCRAGPFTFDVKGDTIEIFLKFESICPIVRLLKEIPEAYEQQYNRAVTHITRLVSLLPEDELEVICRIDEPETEKVGEIPRQYL